MLLYSHYTTHTARKIFIYVLAYLSTYLPFHISSLEYFVTLTFVLLLYALLVFSFKLVCVLAYYSTIH